MQVSAVNSTNFGNGYYTQLAQEDIDNVARTIELLRDYNDTFVKKDTENEEQPQKKSKLGVVASVAIGALGIFVIAKKGYKGVSIFAQDFSKKANASTKKPVVEATKIVNNVKDSIRNSDKFNKIVNNKYAQNVGKFVKDVKPENIFAGAASIGTTAYVARTDGNENGIPDIAEKGVNAYKNALKHVDVVREIVELVS